MANSCVRALAGVKHTTPPTYKPKPRFSILPFIVCRIQSGHVQPASFPCVGNSVRPSLANLKPFLFIADTNCPRRTKAPWVKLAYWEANVRVGTMYNGYERIINVYQTLTKDQGGGFCLNELERTHEMNGPTKLVFKNIGEGVQVSLEDGDVWIHNRSTSPVFINGELLQTLHHTRTPVVQKLASGYGIKVFDCHDVPRNVNKRRSEPHSLRVSFVKGFGRGYKRQYITNCPCWIEMFFFL